MLTMLHLVAERDASSSATDFDAMDAIHEQTKDQYSKGRVILMDPAGRKFDQLHAKELAQEDHF